MYYGGFFVANLFDMNKQFDEMFAHLSSQIGGKEMTWNENFDMIAQVSFFSDFVPAQYLSDQ